MKKFGFTLAELLITLSIIGVSAAMLAPVVSNLMPDMNKSKVVKYNALINNALNSMFNDETIYHPEYSYNQTSNEYTLSCEGLACFGNSTAFMALLTPRLNLDASGNAPDNSNWTFTQNATTGDYTVTIDVNPGNSGCSYSNSCDVKKIDTYLFKIDASGNVLPADALTDAYLQNPLNMNAKKEDLETAKNFLSSKTY